ncbi:hypothetical protein AURDEDRAFT_177563 [Auricularia subglabra TFB-10046 SS5]|uniref:Uncharacterized protein n=1 Tax=Auricularia subglabra (strain TFB-10046 / SS5) TaxID=717982 RepID=J0WND5_AURST|nr:hypothetical protein AURDEDRAFT_177563 [Auricularia subglabra TFB-10046 SS5]
MARTRRWRVRRSQQRTQGAVYCPVFDCFCHCRFTWRLRRSVEFEVAECPTHGVVVLLRPGYRIALLTFARPLAPRESLSLFRCLLCRQKRSNVTAPSPNIVNARAEYHALASVPLEAAPYVTPTSISCRGNVKIKLTCVHSWNASPTRPLGHAEYTANAVLRYHFASRILYSDLSPDVLRSLRLDGLPTNVILKSVNSRYSLAVAPNGLVPYQTEPVPHLRLRVHIRPDEPGWQAWFSQHVTALLPPEIHFEREYPNLGTVLTEIRIEWEGEVREQIAHAYLPRRCFALPACKFYLSDLTHKNREHLGLLRVPNERIVPDPEAPLPCSYLGWGTRNHIEYVIIELKLQKRALCEV